MPVIARRDVFDQPAFRIGHQGPQAARRSRSRRLDVKRGYRLRPISSGGSPREASESSVASSAPLRQQPGVKACALSSTRPATRSSARNTISRRFWPPHPPGRAWPPRRDRSHRRGQARFRGPRRAAPRRSHDARGRWPASAPRSRASPAGMAATIRACRSTTPSRAARSAACTNGCARETLRQPRRVLGHQLRIVGCEVGALDPARQAVMDEVDLRLRCRVPAAAQAARPPTRKSHRPGDGWMRCQGMP